MFFDWLLKTEEATTGYEEQKMLTQDGSRWHQFNEDKKRSEATQTLRLAVVKPKNFQKFPPRRRPPSRGRRTAKI